MERYGLRPMFRPYRNQSSGAHCKGIGWFLYDGNIDFKWINPFHATGLYLYPLKTSEKLWFPDIFSGHRKRLLKLNGLGVRDSFGTLTLHPRT